MTHELKVTYTNGKTRDQHAQTYIFAKLVSRIARSYMFIQDIAA